MCILLAASASSFTGTASAKAAQNGDDNPWSSCISGLDYDSAANAESDIRVLDRWGRDITSAGIAMIDWEGAIENPGFLFQIILPDGIVYPVTIRITSPNAARIYIFRDTYSIDDPWGFRTTYSVHNSQGPLWGETLLTIEELAPHEGAEPQQIQVHGGVDHDLSDSELEALGLERRRLSFFEDHFPLELAISTHGDREGGDEPGTLNIEITDDNGASHQLTLPTHICDQDNPERDIEFIFHIDYSTEFDGYLTETEDGQVVSSFQERVLDDVAYFFTDMLFDTVPAEACEAFVNWAVEEQPSTARNSKAYSHGYYLFINSHSGGGALSSPFDFRHTRNGEDTGFPACGYWGADKRDAGNIRVNTRVYPGEDDWWRVNHWVFGQNGECLGDTVGDPGNGCIECPDGKEWCASFRVDGYWPALHELTHGLIYSEEWTKWKAWKNDTDRCIDDPGVMAYAGVCMPIYADDHAAKYRTTSNKEIDFGRTPIRVDDLYIMQAAGWELRDTTSMVPLSIENIELPAAQVNSQYSGQIVIRGGIPSYYFEVQQGDLPPGLSMNSFTGAISGTPVSAGKYNFKIRVKDSGFYHVLKKNGVNRAFSISVDS